MLSNRLLRSRPFSISRRQFSAANKLRGGTEATRYVHPTTGQSVVIDDLTGEVVQVGGPGFRY